MLTQINKYSTRIFLIPLYSILILTYSCSDDKPTEPSQRIDFQSDNVTIENLVEETVDDISSNGGVIRIDDESSLLNGFSIEVPVRGYDESRTFTISSAKITDHKLGEYFNPISPLISISNGGGYSEYPMQVEIPIQIASDEFAVCFFYDEISGDIEVVPTVDQNSTSITVQTRHFALSSINAGVPLGKLSANGVIANLIVSSFKESLLSGQTVLSSGFTPGVDDWEFINYGSYIAPGGHCAGQSMTAMWYYYEKRLKGEPPLYGKYDLITDPSNPNKLWQDNPLGYRFASTIQADFEFSVWVDRVNLQSRFSKQTYYTFIAAMLVTGEPQFVIVRNSAGKGGHALVCYKIDITEGKMYLADPNYPNNRGINGEQSIRSIRYANEKLQPYPSFQKVGDQGTIYDQIAIFGLTANVDWSQIGKRFQELENGTIGNDRLPEYELMVQTPDSTIPMVDGMTVTEANLEFVCKNDNITFGLFGTDNLQQVFVYDQKGDLIGLANEDGITQVNLLPGENLLGLHISGFKDGRPNNYYDFKWITINYDGPDLGDELEYTKCWMNLELSNLVWEKNDLITGNVFNVYSGGSFGGLTLEGSFSNNKFTGTIDRIRESDSASDTTKGSITVQLNESRDMIVSLEYSVEFWSLLNTINQKSYSQTDLTLQNVPINEGSKTTFEVKGSSVCDYIGNIESFRTSVIPGSNTLNYQETLEEYSCIYGGELTVYFSK